MDADRDYSLPQWQPDSVHPGWIYMHAPGHTNWRNRPNPLYSWALEHDTTSEILQGNIYKKAAD
jgi:hypothetical protein